MFAQLFGSALMIGSAGCIFTHLQSWKQAEQRWEDPLDRRFYVGQARRRMMGSTLMGLLGLAICCCPLITTNYRETAFWAYWISLTVGVVLLMLIALIDLYILQIRFRHQASQRLRQQIELREQILREQRSKVAGDSSLNGK